MLTPRTTQGKSLAVCVTFAVCGAQARAQDQGGIQAGNTVVSPAVEVQAKYHTNLYLVESGETKGPEISLNPTIGLELDAPEAKLDVGADYKARIFPGHSNLNRFNDVGVRTLFDLFPRGRIGLETFFDYDVRARPSEAIQADSAYVQKQDVEGRGLLMIRPGSSLELGAGGFVGWRDYNTDEGISNLGSVNLNNRLEYGPKIDLKWRFFPKTAVVAGYRYSWFYWKDNALWVDTQADWLENYSTEVGDLLGMPDGRNSETYVGMRGQFTEKLVLGAVIGYEHFNYLDESVDDDAANQIAQGFTLGDGYQQDLKGIPEGLIANVEVRYDLTQRHTFRAGYRRDFKDVYFTNFVGYHNVYGEYDGRYGERFLLTLSADYRFEDYVGAYERQDHFIDLEGIATYRATTFLDLKAGTYWVERGSADGGHPEIEFDDVCFYLGAKFFY